MHAWRLDDGHQTVVLAARGNRLPEVVYWGAALPGSEDLDALVDANCLDVTGGMLDETRISRYARKRPAPFRDSPD